MSRERHRREEAAAREWKGASRPYDILREATIAPGVVLALAIGLTILSSSPDDPPSTIKQWSHADPVDFVTTATTELDGSSGTGAYGPPYNRNGNGQYIGFVHLQKRLGVSHPTNAATDLIALAVDHRQRALQRALVDYQAAPVKTQTAWTTAYETALGKAPATAVVRSRAARSLRTAAHDDALAADLRPERRAGWRAPVMSKTATSQPNGTPRRRGGI